MSESNTTAFARLTQVIDTLLGPDGCPWDREQTPETLCDYVLEEAYELVSAVRSGRPQEAREELGDLLFLLLFLARLYAGQGAFTLEDSLDESADKMIRRHPHVFADAQVSTRTQLLDNWERIKREEKAERGRRPPPRNLRQPARPAASPAQGVPHPFQGGAPGVTWASAEDAERQLESEWEEWRNALASGNRSARMQEFGDYVFTLVEVGRRHGIKANTALEYANNKFLNRFGRMEALARERGLELADLSLDALNALWDEIKTAV